MFLDNLDQTQDSYLPYGEFLDMHAVEDKFTATHRIPPELLPSWLRINGNRSIDYRLDPRAVISSATISTIARM